MRFSGATERAFTGWTPPWIRYQHLERYKWACSFVAGKRVLDAACGNGYGSIALAQGGAASVEGIDVSQHAVATAQERYAHPVLQYRVGSVDDLPIEDESIDVYVSFETIEHLQSELAYLQEATRVLRSGGLFLCSTPNRELTNPGIELDGKPFNVHHVREYAQQEFVSLMSSHFDEVTLLAQSPYTRRYRRILTAFGRRMPPAAVRIHQLRKVLQSPWDASSAHTPKELRDDDEPEFMIAVCRKR